MICFYKIYLSLTQLRFRYQRKIRRTYLYVEKGMKYVMNDFCIYST